MPLSVCNCANTSQVMTSSDHAQVTCVKLDELLDLACSNVNLHRIINFHKRVRITNGTSVMGNHKSCWIGIVSADFPINFDKPLLHNLFDLSIRQSILQPVPQEKSHRKTLTGFVGSTAWFWGKSTASFVQHP